MGEIGWIDVIVETPAQDIEPTAAFWAQVTRSAVEHRYGDRVLHPADGDPYVIVRPTGRHRRSVSLRLGAVDTEGLRDRAIAAGATAAGDQLRSPGQFRFEIGPVGGPTRRPPPVAHGHLRSRLDQVCIDLPPPIFDREVGFWSTLTGWEAGTGRLEEFRALTRPDGIPVRLLLQRLGAGHRGRRARAHLDLAAGDGVDDLIAHHESWGATRGRRGVVWHTMSDPSGLSYCLTGRDPDAGIVPETP